MPKNSLVWSIYVDWYSNIYDKSSEMCSETETENGRIIESCKRSFSRDEL